ncbi:tetratricopeptide repeat protein [Candidatus Poribacteria bacterium]|nr:tetratricopeptide repeat protein [Candidatus Poribacteria bacterium]
MCGKKLFTFFFSMLLLSTLVYAAIAQQYAVIYRRNGDRYMGIWRGADEQFNRVDLLDGQKLKVPVDETLYILFISNLNDVPDVTAQKYFTNGKQFLELGMLEEAKEQFRAAIKEFPRCAGAYYELGILLEKEGKVEAALQHFERAAMIAPERFDIANRFKDVFNYYLAQGQYSKAIEVGLTLFSYYSSDPIAQDIIFQVGFLFAEQLKDPDKAITTLTDAISGFPNNPHAEKARYVVGLMYQIKGDAQDAISMLTKFINTYSYSEWLDDAYLVRGKAYLVQRYNQEALADFNQAIIRSKDDVLKREAKAMRDESAWNIFTVPDGLPSNIIQAIASDGNFLWVGTPKGVAKIEVANGAWNSVPDELGLSSQPDVRALAVNEEKLWIGTLNDGLIMYDKGLKTITEYRQADGLPGNEIYTIKLFGDEVWAGTFSGVGYLDPQSGGWIRYTSANGLPANDIVALAVNANSVWVGTSQKGVAVFDKNLKTWRRLSNLPNNVKLGNSIKSIVAGPDSVWIGWYGKYENGYCAYNINTDEWKGSPAVMDDTIILEDISLAVEEYETWLATNIGMYRHIGDWVSEIWDPISYPKRLGENLRVKCLLLADSVAWVGTTNGLGRVDGRLLAR